MNNKETLQNHNTRVNTNNDKLLEILQTVNELPEAGEGGTPEIKPRYIHLIKDGVEQAGNTGGIQIKVTTGDATQGQMFNGDGYLGLGAKIWSDVEFNIPNKFDLTEYTIAVVEWAYPRASSPYAHQNAVAKLVINPYQGDNAENVLLTSNGTTVARHKDTYIITKATGDDSIAFHLSNTFDTHSDAPVTAYPVQIFNLYLENPNANIQDKIVEINENGTTIVSPDEGYAALNSVEINVEVGSDPEEKKYLYLVKDGVEQIENTGGYTLASIYGGTGNNTVKQGDGFLGLCSQIWSCWTMTFKNKIDFARYPKLYIEYAYPQTSTPYARDNVVFSIYRVGNKTEDILINKTGVKQKTLDVFDFSQDAIIEQLQIRFGNNGDGSNYANYPIQLFNLYFEENPRPLQNKNVEITQNGVTEVTFDEEYAGLNKVKITTLVSTGDSEVFSTEEVTTNKVWIDGKPIYRKVFETKFPTITHDYSSYSTTTIDVSSLNIDTVVDLDGTITETTNFWTLNFYNHLAGASVVSTVSNGATTLSFTTNSKWLSTSPIMAILEYTKTTDTATTIVEEE